ncbi:MarR family transcriptional regulator, partial [Bifidobacterium longum]
TYMSICHPGRPRPTAEQVREAFVERDKRVAEHMAAKRAEN